MNNKLKFLKEDGESCIIGFDEIEGKDIPIISCWRVDDWHVAFFCIDCKKFHLHGWANGNPSGYRAAHCDNVNSRFVETGYILAHQADLTDPIQLERYLNEGKQQLPTPNEIKQ